MDLLQKLRAEEKAGAVQVRKGGPGTPFMAPWRDLGNCWGVLVGEAVTLTDAAIRAELARAVEARKNTYSFMPDGAEDRCADKLRVLDGIGRMYHEIYQAFLKDQLQGMALLGQLYDELDNSRQVAADTYGTFTAFLAQAMFAWMFTSRKMAVGMAGIDDKQVGEFNAVLEVLAGLDTEARNTILDKLARAGFLASTVNYAPLRKRLEDYAGYIKADQAAEAAKAVSAPEGGVV